MGSQGPERDTTGPRLLSWLWLQAQASLWSWAGWASPVTLAVGPHCPSWPFVQVPGSASPPHASGLGTAGLQFMALPQLSAQVMQASAHSFNKLGEALHHRTRLSPIKSHSSPHLRGSAGSWERRADTLQPDPPTAPQGARRGWKWIKILPA